MDHHEAKRLMAVEQYLLDELPPQVRDEFEEHFFDCEECSTDLRATAVFLDATKKELAAASARQPAPVPIRKSRFASFWLPVFALPALAACLLVVAYQNLVVFPRFKSQIAQLSAPEILPSLSLVGGNSRGDQTPSITVHRAQPFLLLVDIPTQERFSRYTCLLYSPSGSLAWRVQLSAQQAKDTISIRVPAVNRTGGIYSLLVQGNTDHAPEESSVDLARYRFTLSSQE